MKIVLKISIIILSTLVLNAKSTAERGYEFYEFEDNNTSHAKKNSNQSQTSTNSKVKSDGIKILEKLLKVAREQKEIQQKILDTLKEEFNPTPQKVTINGVECIANSSADCFVMPLTKDAKRIPVLKAMLVNPTPETAKNYLQWQAKYLSTGPFKVGRSFQYAMNTYGEEAYPMNITRPSNNSNTNVLYGKRARVKQQLLNDRYSNGTLGLYVFLQSSALDYFSISQISQMLKSVKNKKAISLIFKTQKDKKNFLESSKATKRIRDSFKDVTILINPQAFAINNIYMTPTYMSVSNVNKISKKQAVAIGRVGKDELNTKIYEWLEQESIVKRGALSDYKVWNKDKKDVE